MYLVDTDVISSGAPGRERASDALSAWMDRNSEVLFLSAITVAEIESGIAKARREGARRKASRLTAWFEALLHLYESRVLAFDVKVARVAGALTDLARSKGHAPGFADLAIAATAVANRLTLLTGNVRHFAPLRIRVMNPFEEVR